MGSVNKGLEPAKKPAVKNCADKSPTGNPSFKFDYAYKGLTGDDDYPSDACTPWLHYNLKVNILRATTDIISPGVPSLQSKAAFWDSKKPFDILHPTKEGYRLRYVCLEGPFAEVYTRGVLKDSSVIELPEHWRGLVDSETIGVTLTPIGCYQELFWESIEWGSKLIIKNNAGGPIHCHYVVFGERKDTSKNIPEYPGLTPADYPGDNNEYSLKLVDDAKNS